MNLGRRPSPRRRSSSCLELVDPHPVLVGRDLDHLGLVAAEHGNRARVRRRLADRPTSPGSISDLATRSIACWPPVVTMHIVGVGQHSLRAHHLEDAVLGLLEALGRPVLQGLRRGLLRDLRHLRRELCGREVEVSGRPPASEITSGRAVIAIRSRIAEQRMTFVRAAKSPA